MSINPYVFPIKGDISRSDAVNLYEEAIRSKSPIFEFGAGGSTIFLAASGKQIYCFEDTQKWIDRVERNIDLFSSEYKLDLSVCFNRISYTNNAWKKEVLEDIKSQVPSLYFVDGLTATRQPVLDLVLENANIGDVILIHDTRRPGDQRVVTDMLNKYYNRIDSCQFNINRSNTTKIVVGDTLNYVNWNEDEYGNFRKSWNKDDV